MGRGKSLARAKRYQLLVPSRQEGTTAHLMGLEDVAPGSFFGRAEASGSCRLLPGSMGRPGITGVGR